MTNARKIPELLAPAGGMEQLRAALRFGADAVYGGMKHYGLRAFAGNFDAQELAQAVELCHRQGKKFYVTMNIFPFDDQLPGFVEAARQAWEIGVDAAIVSDLGAICTLREQVPGLELIGAGTAPHILPVTLPGYKSEVVLRFLSDRGIYVSSGSACHKGKPSHVYAALKLPKPQLDGILRISFSYDTAREDVDALVQGLKEAQAQLFTSLS